MSSKRCCDVGVPGLFAPERRDGRYLIDGGALNNIPFDVARRLGADYVIASNVSSHRGPLFHDRRRWAARLSRWFDSFCCAVARRRCGKS